MTSSHQIAQHSSSSSGFASNSYLTTTSSITPAMSYTSYPGYEAYQHPTPFPPELLPTSTLHPPVLASASYPPLASTSWQSAQPFSLLASTSRSAQPFDPPASTSHSAQPFNPQAQYVADQPAPYPVVRTVHAFGPRHSVETERGQFMRVGVIQVCKHPTFCNVFLTVCKGHKRRIYHRSTWNPT